MRSSTRACIVRSIRFSPFVLIIVLIWMGSAASAQAQAPSHAFTGQVIIDGRSAPDGTLVQAWVSGDRIHETRTRGGKFSLTLVSPPGLLLHGKRVVFAGVLVDRSQFRFSQESRWQSGGNTKIALKLGGPGGQRRAHTLVHTFEGNLTVQGRPAPDNTTVAARIEDQLINQTMTKGGRFLIRVAEKPGNSFADKTVVFGGRAPDGKRYRAHQTAVWKPGRNTNISITFGGSRGPSSPVPIPNLPVPQFPGVMDMGCIVKVLGRIPSGPQDLSPSELMRTIQCFGGGGLDDQSSLEWEKQRLEQERAFQLEQQSIEAERIKQERAFEHEQQRLEAERTAREQKRIKRDQKLQEEQDRLDRDRLKSEHERQQEQARLDIERRKQDQDRIEAEQEMQLEQRRLDQRRAMEEQQRHAELEKARFESERARIDRERVLEEQRARLDQERLQREAERIRREEELGEGRQGQAPDGPTRGFFTNSQVGQLGSVNKALDPSTLAVFGILITLVATTLQLVRGN